MSPAKVKATAGEWVSTSPTSETWFTTRRHLVWKDIARKSAELGEMAKTAVACCTCVLKIFTYGRQPYTVTEINDG
jgi:hypothetical protein